MAEAVLNIVLGKLAEVIKNEAQLLGGVGNKVERVQRELTRIKCCLKDADSKSKGDAMVQNWFNELRDVAYRIEDATDTFSLEVEDHHQKNPRGVQNSKGCSRFLQKLKELFKKPSEVPILHKLGNELDAIQNLLEEIYNSRLTYGIRDRPLKDESKGDAVKMPFRRATYSEVDETQVVGMQADKSNILKLLCDPEQPPRLAVITIVGIGGVGKTTLAHMVYTSAQADFDYHKMLPVSQQFSLTDLLRKIISKDNNYVLNDRDVDYYVDELKTFLSTKRYLIILDDVWTGDLWIALKEVLPDNNNGSRVLITTRHNDVAKLADSKITPYELNLLNERESRDLLLKKAFPYQEPDKQCPKDLLELVTELSKKCNGLPLALIVLGGILATKELSYPAWERVLKTMDWHSDGSNCMQILSMSYEDMPYYLKACFQYLTSFPENWDISAKCLIRMWIAEGFIPLEEGKPTIQIMVEDYLEELANRSMVQVLSRSMNGLIKHFKVHDLLRELAMHEAKRENFVVVFSQASDDKKPDRIIRRASLQAQERNPRFVEYVGPKTRSLLLFGFDNCEMSLHCSNFRLLKVLEIVGTWKSKYELKSLGELIHLKYLGLRNCNIDLSSCSFHGMRSLETLDVRESVGTPPCDDIWSIGTLMHVLDDEFRTFFKRPLPIDTLSNLQTLKWVVVKRACDAKLPNLRKLGITNIKFSEWVSITNLLKTLPVLVSLGIHADDYLPIEIVYPKALPNYHNLQSLHLNGRWPKNVKVEARLFPRHLIKLTLRYTYLNDDPMLELGKLNSLKKLCLGCHAFTNDWESPINCQEQGFPALQYVEMSDKNIKNLKWEIIERVCVAKFPNLRKLDIRNVSDEWVSTIKLLQSLRFLVSLRINAEEKSLPPEIVYPKALPNYHNLQSLDLNGRWPENVKVEARLFPPHLLELSLKYTSLNHNPIPELGRLNNLKKLCLGSNALNWEGPIICREGFPDLQHLEVTDEKIQDLTVVEGVMSKLTHLNVHSDIKMHLPPELHDVTVKKTSVNIVFID